MERAVQVFAAVSFLVIGLSHIFQPGAWVEFFTRLRSLGRPGVFAEGFISLNFGALIVSFHNVWSGPAVVLTLIGWGQVLKALFRFVAPAATVGAEAVVVAPVADTRVAFALKSLTDKDMLRRATRLASRGRIVRPVVSAPGTDYRNIHVINAQDSEEEWFRHTR